MADKNFDLNKAIKNSPLYTPVDYGDLLDQTQSLSGSINQTLKNFENYRQSLGVKTEEEKQEEFKKIYEGIQERTKDLGEGDSATDWYMAIQQDPQEQAEWKRNAAITNKIGLAVATLPWTITGGAGMYKTLSNSLNNPLTRAASQRAAAKAGMSTLIGEMIDRGSQDTKLALNNSSIGDSNLNKYFLRPTLSIMPLLDLDGTVMDVAHGARKLNDVHADIFGINAATTRIGKNHLGTQGKDITVEVGKAPIYRGTEYSTGSQNIKNIGPSSHNYHKMMVQTFGPDVIEESFPFLDQYLTGIHPSLHEEAKKAYLADMLSGDAFRANGSGIIMSGSEITKRALGKTKNYGNDGLVLLRSDTEKHLSDPLNKMYALLAHPGMVDKYVLTDKGTNLKGLINSDKWNDWRENVLVKDAEKVSILNELRGAIGSKDREKSIQLFRKLVDIESKIPSGVQRFNAKPIPEKWKFADVAEELGNQYMGRLMGKSEFPLEHGLEYSVNGRKIEPLIMRDDASALFLPHLQHIDAKSKIPFDEYTKWIAATPEYKKIAQEIQRRYPDITSQNVYTDNLLEVIAPNDGRKAISDVVITYGPDGTENLKGVPIVMSTSSDVFKSIGKKAEGTFNPSNSSVFKKFGGNIPSYLKKFGGK